MKNYTEKENNLKNALTKLNAIGQKFSIMKNDVEILTHQKNQLIREKQASEEKYSQLIKEHHSLQSQLDKVKEEVNNKFSSQNELHRKVDELNQETENLLGEIDKW